MSDVAQRGIALLKSQGGFGSPSIDECVDGWVRHLWKEVGIFEHEGATYWLYRCGESECSAELVDLKDPSPSPPSLTRAELESQLAAARDEIAAKQQGYDELHAMVNAIDVSHEGADIWTKVDALIQLATDRAHVFARQNIELEETKATLTMREAEWAQTHNDLMECQKNRTHIIKVNDRDRLAWGEILRLLRPLADVLDDEFCRRVAGYETPIERIHKVTLAYRAQHERLSPEAKALLSRIEPYHPHTLVGMDPATPGTDISVKTDYEIDPHTGAMIVHDTVQIPGLEEFTVTTTVAPTRKVPQRGVDFACEECGKLEGSSLENGFYRCHGCGFPGQ